MLSTHLEKIHMNLHLNSVLIYTCMYLLINYQVIEGNLVLYKIGQKVLTSLQ